MEGNIVNVGDIGSIDLAASTSGPGIEAAPISIKEPFMNCRLFIIPPIPPRKYRRSFP